MISDAAQVVLGEAADPADSAVDMIEKQLTPGLPEEIHASVKEAFKSRLKHI